MPEHIRNLTSSTRHAAKCHRRWMEHLNRDMDAPDYRDEWRTQQCGGCAYFIRLRGALTDDWGACTNEKSPMDKQVMFEHDGCEEFVASANGW